ncbi:uncharacterized protein LOC126058720 [Elephas maximus indicus]|uniref:uncharacterized protein LOC126058720 n=1 Tax=Elephas maximus indicus TaxID=99487 RepID=UPI002116D8B2|nr:uncharacterized protein LOC126058720 [Elephas maximus indicus]
MAWPPLTPTVYGPGCCQGTKACGLGHSARAHSPGPQVHGGLLWGGCLGGQGPEGRQAGQSAESPFPAAQTQRSWSTGLKRKHIRAGWCTAGQALGTQRALHSAKLQAQGNGRLVPRGLIISLGDRGPGRDRPPTACWDLHILPHLAVGPQRRHLESNPLPLPIPQSQAKERTLQSTPGCPYLQRGPHGASGASFTSQRLHQCRCQLLIPLTLKDF